MAGDAGATVSSEPDDGSVVRFGVFEVDRRSGELRRQGRRVGLGEKPFQLLSALLERPGEVVLRDELRQRLWPPDVHVDFDRNLNTAATNLRAALGDSAASPRFIETLPKRGYRFIAPVEPVGDPPRRGRGWPIAAIAAGIALGLAIAVGWNAWQGPPQAASERLMVAVMPFVELGPDPGEAYLPDGLTEELISQLGRLDPERLGVIARMSAMSYRGTNKRVDQIASELGVDFVVEGSLRRFDDRLRVVVQLARAADQSQLWSTTFEESTGDVLGVQVDLAARAAEGIGGALLPDQEVLPARPSTTDAAAFAAYLEGRYEWNRFTVDGYHAAIEHLERAVELDDGYALAWAGLADAHNLLAFHEPDPRSRFALAREAARRALAIDPELAEGHNSIAFGLLYSDFDVAAADEAFTRALTLNPNLAMAHHWRAGVLAVQQRHDDAVEAMRRAVELDPRSLSVSSDLGWYLLFADRYGEAVDECRRTLALRDDYGWAAACLFEGLFALGDYDGAFAAESERMLATGAASEEELAALAELPPAAAVDALFELHLERLRQEEEPYAISMAQLSARLGAPQNALDWLDRALERGDGWVLFLRVDPRFDSLHGVARFERMARGLHLPTADPDLR